MAQRPAQAFSLDVPLEDVVMPFEAQGLDVRGRIVSFGPLVDTILARHGYPEPVSRLVGEAIALTALLGTSLKFDGRFILQTQGDGPVSMLVVDMQKPNHVRACAKFDEERVRQVAGQSPGAPARLLGQGHMAMTVDQGPQTNRYQGVVPLEGQSLADAADLYFRQSEQIPTMVHLAVAQNTSAGGDKRMSTQWRAGGILIQHLPGPGASAAHRDLPPGNVPDGIELAEFEEPDTWTEAKALLGTVQDHELTDPTLTPQRLLFRLFHERGVRVFEGERMEEACRCSRERIANMLRQFSAEERADMVTDEGAIEVVCEFCSAAYLFDPDELKPDG